ncbi:hypothetical protein F5I97DRAFT_1806643 [Phlebopus sp. FC_14]|nr:hypothetical protein F5I97DRAFT_1806643 [Phlebopus sp. FC_14]
MSTNSMTPWLQSRLSALYEAPDDDAFQKAFDRAFSSTCEMRLDHAAQRLEYFRADLDSRRIACKNTTVRWENLTSTSDEPDKASAPSVVAGSLVVTRFLPFRIRASPAQRNSHINFSAKIEQEVTAQADEQGDRHRITSFYYTSVDSTPPIHLSVPRAAKNSDIEK